MIRKQPTDDRRPIAGPGIPMTRQQIAEALGISRGRVWKIETAAMQKIRHELEKRGFDPGELD